MTLTPSRSAVIAFGVLVSIGALFVYGRVFREDTPGDYPVKKGNYRLEDGQFERAIEQFELALEKNPAHTGAMLGLGVTYTQMEEYDRALAALDAALELDPEFAVAYANRGIVRDRTGEYAAALADYRRALEIDPRLSKGPGWLWRFMRNIDNKPPTIADRAAYLETELAKPPEERLLSVPEIDAAQRMYKVD